VRSRNDDFALAFELAGCQVAMIADGVSGEPLGGAAAFTACRSAAWSVIQQLGAPGAVPSKLEQVAGQAIRAAAITLVKKASVGGCTRGFRTTLILVVANAVEYGFAYIGDGEGSILRADGRRERFLMPHRAEGQPANLLSACLGPTILGAPVTGSLPRLPGDLLVMGTDGVFSDAVEFPESLMSGLLRASVTFAGNLQLVVDQVIAELCSAQDDQGFLFDDNLSLALMGTGHQPQSRMPQEQLGAHDDSSEPAPAPPVHPPVYQH
jgi:hypothetical protein